MKSILSYIGRGFENLFLWSSGASLTILKEVPSERSKYFGVGGTVLFTAMMATLAGGYAFYTAFKEVGLSIGFGIFWGCLIFNLDRYIVSSFGSGDGKRTISKQELIDASPRVLVAIILGLIVSTPLEMKLFEDEIMAQVGKNIQAELAANGAVRSNDPALLNYQAEKKKIISTADKRKSTIDSLKYTWDKDNNEATREKMGRRSGVGGAGSEYKRLVGMASASERAYNSYLSDDVVQKATEAKRNSELDSLIKVRQDFLISQGGNIDSLTQNNNGFLARYNALNQLSADPENKYSVHPVTVLRFVIALLFIIIEIAPILFKMLTERGPYDDIMDRIKYETRVRQMELQSNLNQEINTAVQIHTAKFDEKLKAEMQTNEEVLKAVAKAQQELALIAIAKWKEEQKAKMQQTDLHGVASTFG